MPTLRQQKLVRINKLLAQSTNFSRREIDKLIDEQRVVVDNELVTKQGIQISINSIVKIDNKPIKLKSDHQLNDIYIFNKPRGCLVTKSDPKNRKTIYEYIPKQNHNLISIGRLDYNSEGLLLLTNSGSFKRKMELPKNNFERVYKVKIQGFIDNKFINTLLRGYTYKNVKYKPIKASFISKTNTYSWIKMTLTEGKNKEIRNIFDSLNITVTRLIRITYGEFKLGGLKKGEIKKVT